MVAAVLAIRGIELQRQPQLDVVVHDVEAGRHDADDLVLRAVHFDRLPDDVGSRRERRPPQLTGQHDEPRTVWCGSHHVETIVPLAAAHQASRAARR